MSQGVHNVHIDITGTTKHFNIDTNTSLTVSATINALVMDADIHTVLQNIDLASSGGGFSNIRAFGYFTTNMLGYLINDTSDSIVTIVNKGNVILSIKTELMSQIDGSLTDSTDYSINISDSTNFIVHSGYYLLFQIYGNNTACDINKFLLQSNGCAYIFFNRL